jgi:hypothetical protein
MAFPGGMDRKQGGDMIKPLAIDLFCGLGGWTDGLLVEGWDVVGFDIERHEYGGHRYPAQLVIQDVLTLHGSQFKNADLIVASSPCTEYSYMAMPWPRAKRIAAALRGEGEFPEDYRGSRTVADLNRLFDACFRIQREACEAAERHIPLIAENVKGAQPWVGRARWNFGSFYLWGDVPALMPIGNHVKVPSFRFDGTKKSFQTASVRRTDVGRGARFTSRDCGIEGIKHRASGAAWFDTGPAALPPGSTRRKAASAMIAKIPKPLSQWIAASFKPEGTERAAA